MASWRDRVWQLFERDVFPTPSSDRLFNPYRDRHAALDVPGAPAIRRANLRAALGAVPTRPPLLVVAEAPGPWGCRFSGVPLVSERQLLDPSFPVHGRPTSLGEPHREYSGSIYWRVLRPAAAHLVTWNSVPLHPHDPEAPLTIRTPRAAEVRAFHPHLADLLDVLRPRVLVALGRKAEGALTAVGAAPVYVRHPSQGGARLFEAGMRAVLADLGLQRGY